MEIILIIIFLVSMIVGYFLINQVPPLLHTPLMSGMNALSGITLTGALLTTALVLQKYDAFWSGIVGGVAIISATVNLVAGFLVTDKMLKLFKKGNKKND